MVDDINNLKINIAVINEKLDSQCKKLDSVLSMLETHIKDEENRYSEIMKLKADKIEVDRLKDNQTWVVRLVIGLVITALVSLILIK